MPFDAGTIAGRLELNTSGFTSGFLQAQGIASAFPQILINFVEDPLLGVISVAEAAGKALVGMFNEAMSAGQQLDHLSQASGISVESLDRLGKAAETVGGNVSMVGDMARFLSRNMSEAASGGKEASEAFAKVGVSVTDAAGQMRPIKDVMLEVSDAFARMPDGAQKSAEALQLFGRGGTDVIPFLNMGKGKIDEIGDSMSSMGSVMTESQAKTAAAWESTTAQISGAWSGLMNLFAQPIEDALIPHLKNVMAWMDEHAPAIQTIISDIGKTIGWIGDVAGTVIDYVMKLVGPLIDAIQTVSSGVHHVLQTIGWESSEPADSVSSSSTPAPSAASKPTIPKPPVPAIADASNNQQAGDPPNMPGYTAGVSLENVLALQVNSVAIGHLTGVLESWQSHGVANTASGIAVASQHADASGGFTIGGIISSIATALTGVSAGGDASADNRSIASNVLASAITSLQPQVATLGGSLDALNTSIQTQLQFETQMVQSISSLLSSFASLIDRLTNAAASVFGGGSSASPGGGNVSTNVQAGPINVSYGSADATSQLARQLQPQLAGAFAEQKRAADATAQLNRVRSGQGSF